MPDLEETFSRRQLLTRVGAAGLTFAGLTLLAGCGGGSSSSNAASAPTQTDVLNFALNLEYLEAQFYSYAVNGTGIPAADTGNSAATVTGFAKITFSDPVVAAVAAELAADELAHVMDLRAALGPLAVPMPALNLAALGAPTTDATFLKIARALEDTGVSAYAGAATLLSGTYLQDAAQILAVEAYHGGNIRLLVAQKGIATSAIDSMDVLPPPSGTKYFTTNSAALAIARTPSEVLAIVYANSAAGTSSGGFFPSGLNGNIKSV